MSIRFFIIYLFLHNLNNKIILLFLNKLQLISITFIKNI